MEKKLLRFLEKNSKEKSIHDKVVECGVAGPSAAAAAAAATTTTTAAAANI